MALAHELEEERGRRESLERRARDVLRRALVRIDDVLEKSDSGGRRRGRVVSRETVAEQRPPAKAGCAETPWRQASGLEEAGLLRVRPEAVAEVARSFCSNDYLGLGGELAPAAPAGAGASRLIVGERPEHLALESALAAWLRRPVRARLLERLRRKRRHHRRARRARRRHRQRRAQPRIDHRWLPALARHVVVAEHLGSGGRRARPATASERSRLGRDGVVLQHGRRHAGSCRGFARSATSTMRRSIVDEAHALGVFGARRAGALRESAASCPTCSSGRWERRSEWRVPSSQVQKSWSHGSGTGRGRSSSRPGVSPATAVAALRSLGVIAEGDGRRVRLTRTRTRLRSGLLHLGLSPLGHGPIVPLVIGDPRRAVAVAAALRAEGVHVQAVRPPRCPPGTARIRMTTTALHSPEDIDHALRAIERTLPWPAPSS